MNTFENMNKTEVLTISRPEKIFKDVELLPADTKVEDHIFLKGIFTYSEQDMIKELRHEIWENIDVLMQLITQGAQRYQVEQNRKDMMGKLGIGGSDGN